MRINSISGKSLIDFQSRNRHKEDLRYQEAYRVLNDPLIQDSIAITLAQTMAQKQVCDKSIRVEDFIKNVLNLFAFNTRVQKTSKDIDEFIANTPNGELLIQRKSYDEFETFKKEIPANNLDERIANFSKSHRINKAIVLPEAMNALKELPQEYLDILPDGIISYVLKECSYEEKLFNEPKMTIGEKIDLCKKMKKDKKLNSWSIENNKKRLEKLMFARNLTENVAKIPSSYTKEDLKELFRKNENNRYVNQACLKAFKNWLNSYPDSTSQQGHYDILFAHLKSTSCEIG